MKIIDTPGFRDSRGVKLDDEHVKKNCDYILEEREINCIFIVQNGREARISTQLKYGYSSLISILPRVIS